METKNGFFIKDLRIIGNKKLKDIVIVDNLAHSFGFQIENGIPILEWYSDSSDMELKNLVNLLSEAARCEDVRELLKARLRLDELIEFNLE
jgi:CTD small phosphatase-like protein 2